MDHLLERVEALEHQTKAKERYTQSVERLLRWWRVLACGLIGVALLTWALPSVTAQDAQKKKKDLEERVATLEDLLKHFTRDGNEVIITGANLHIVNGLGATESTNELGNLIVGYNEPRIGNPNNRTGSHNVVVGNLHNFSSFGGLVVGQGNAIIGRFSSISGGSGNVASGRWSSISGGSSNVASGDDASVSGGNTNTASGHESSVSGGSENTASGLVASVSGGLKNIASEEHSSVSGGGLNMASGLFSLVSGGSENTASGTFASVSGGHGRTAEGENDWVAGSLFEDQ